MEKNIDWSKIERITLQGGEILYDEKAQKFYFWLTKDKNVKVNVITNGVLIDEKWANLLVPNARWITISVNAASKAMYRKIHHCDNFDKVIDNIKKLLRVKNEQGLNTIIKYHFTIITANVAEIPCAIKLADALNCDAISFSFDDGVQEYLEGNKLMVDDIRRNLHAVIMEKSTNIKICRNVLEHLGLVENIKSSQLIESYI